MCVLFAAPDSSFLFVVWSGTGYKFTIEMNLRTDHCLLVVQPLGARRSRRRGSWFYRLSVASSWCNHRVGAPFPAHAIIYNSHNRVPYDTSIPTCIFAVLIWFNCSRNQCALCIPAKLPNDKIATYYFLMSSAIFRVCNEMFGSDNNYFEKHDSYFKCTVNYPTECKNMVSWDYWTFDILEGSTADEMDLIYFDVIFLAKVLKV